MFATTKDTIIFSLKFFYAYFFHIKLFQLCKVRSIEDFLMNLEKIQGAAPCFSASSAT